MAIDSTNEYTERFEEEDDKIKYIRTVTLISGQTADIEIYLTKNYLADTDEKTAAAYLNHAVAGVIARHEVQDAD